MRWLAALVQLLKGALFCDTMRTVSAKLLKALSYDSMVSSICIWMTEQVLKHVMDSYLSNLFKASLASTERRKSHHIQ